MLRLITICCICNQLCFLSRYMQALRLCGELKLQFREQLIYFGLGRSRTHKAGSQTRATTAKLLAELQSFYVQLESLRLNNGFSYFRIKGSNLRVVQPLTVSNFKLQDKLLAIYRQISVQSLIKQYSKLLYKLRLSIDTLCPDDMF